MNTSNDLFLKVSVYPFGENSRDQREIEAAYKAGWKNIHVLSSKGINEVHSNPIWTSTELNLNRSKKKSIFKFAGKVKIFFDFVAVVREKKPRVISGHDLLGMLIAYMGSIGRRRNTILIYDAHEYEMGRFTGKKRGLFIKKMIALLEKFLIKKSAFTILVNNTIAERMYDDYSLRFPSVIVRNIPAKRAKDTDLTKQVQKEWRERLNLTHKDKILLYHGQVIPGRGIETAIKLCAKCKNVSLVVMGETDKGYLGDLQALIKNLGLKNKVYFQNAVDGAVLSSYIAASDVELVLIEPVSESYFYSLPNKLFEAIHSGIPVLASNLPEISNIVIRYEVGTVCNVWDLEDVKTKLETILQPERYNTYKKNTIKAAEELNWENESKVLINKFRQLRESVQ